MHMRKIYFVNIVTGFQNVLNQLKKPDAELCVLLSKMRMAYPERFWLRNLYGILDHGNICSIEINQYFTWYLVIVSQAI